MIGTRRGGERRYKCTVELSQSSVQLSKFFEPPAHIRYVWVKPNIENSLIIDCRVKSERKEGRETHLFTFIVFDFPSVVGEKKSQ